MAIAKRCDICGTYYEPYNIAVSGPEAKKLNNGITFISNDNNGRYFAGECMDCCPICLGSIKDRIEQLKRS